MSVSVPRSAFTGRESRTSAVTWRRRALDLMMLNVIFIRVWPGLNLSFWLAGGRMLRLNAAVPPFHHVRAHIGE